MTNYCKKCGVLGVVFKRTNKKLFIYECGCQETIPVDTRSFTENFSKYIWSKALEEAAELADKLCSAITVSCDWASGYQQACSNLALEIRCLKEKSK